MDHVVLRAVELLSKEGFDDGDILDDLLGENGFDPLARPADDDGEGCLDPGFGGAVLCEAVRRHLASRLVGFEIDYDLSIAHNPVRLSGWDSPRIQALRDVLDGVVARVSNGEVLDIADALAPRFPEARAGSKSLPAP